MKIVIDQSGKLENTNKPTVVGFSNGTDKTIIIIAKEKQKLQKYFRKIGKPRSYIYFTFAIMIFSLIKRNVALLSQIIIDREYPGQESLIKNYLMGFIKTHKELDRRSLYFDEIGKSAKVHGIVWRAYKKKKADITVTADDIINKFL